MALIGTVLAEEQHTPELLHLAHYLANPDIPAAYPAKLVTIVWQGIVRPPHEPEHPARQRCIRSRAR